MARPPDPLRELPDGTPCWCVDPQPNGHSPKCQTHRNFKSVKGEQPVWLQASAHARTRALQDAFIGAYANTGIIRSACMEAGINRDTVDNWRKADKDFVLRMERAELEAADLVEAEVQRRAVVGWLEPVYQQGQHVGDIRKFSDSILTMHMKALKPAKYRENIRQEVTGPDGGPLQHAILPTMEDHERQLLRKVLEDAIKAQEDAEDPAHSEVSENVG